MIGSEGQTKIHEFYLFKLIVSIVFKYVDWTLQTLEWNGRHLLHTDWTKCFKTTVSVENTFLYSSNTNPDFIQFHNHLHHLGYEVFGRTGGADFPLLFDGIVASKIRIVLIVHQYVGPTLWVDLAWKMLSWGLWNIAFLSSRKCNVNMFRYTGVTIMPFLTSAF